jgi:DNA-binding NarL/FixJ family response regulator
LFHTGSFTSQISAPTPDLILLSLDLPQEGGIELLRIIKAYVRTQKIPIVLLGDASTLIPRLEKSPLDINRFVVKSGNREVFTQAVTRAVSYWLDADASHVTSAGADNASAYAVSQH